MINRYYKKSMLLFLVIIITLNGCTYKENDGYLSNVNEVIEKIKENASEVDYKEYLALSFPGSYIIYNHTTEERKQDDEFCSLIYDKVIIKNISGQSIDVNLKMFLPYELATKYVFSSVTLGPREKENFTLKENEWINISFVVIARHYDTLNSKQKEIFDQYRNTLYFEFEIDGKKAYARLDADITAGEDDTKPEDDYIDTGDHESISEENYADAISVLCYHHIIPGELPKTATTKAVVPLREFEEQMKFLQENGYHSLNLKDVENFIYEKQNLPEKSVLITFDDGYESNYVYALPIMQKYDLKFTVFLIGKEVKEESQEAFNPDKLTYLTSTQIKEMASTGIVEFANHTYNLHRYIDKSAAIFSKTRQEIADDFKLMSELFQTLDLPLPVTISYPYGVHNEKILEESKDKGYKLGFTIQEGQVHQDADPFKLNRFIVPPGMTLEQFEKLFLRG